MIGEVNMIGLQPGEKIEPKALAAKMQAMFMEVMLKTMEDNVGSEDGLFGGSSSSDIYRGMLREQLAASISAQMDSPLEGQISKAVADREGKSNLNPGLDDALPVSGVISSPMGWRHDPIDGKMRFHKGMDIAAPSGTVVKAVANGTVVESGLKGGYGNAVVIATDDGRRMLFAHNQQNFVRVGDRVARGEAIAQVGSTGRSTGPHVHFEVSE